MEDLSFLRELLERILFDEKELIKLKDGIVKLTTGNLSSKELKEQIIQFRSALLEELVSFFPYYLKQYTKANTISQYQNPDKHRQLEERDVLLEKIGIHLQKLYEKLNSKKIS